MHPYLLPLLISLTIAHVKIILPIPYGTSSLNTNPLLASGADYPCKTRPDAYTITQWNTIPLNEPQPLKFQGQATHGGGSCQISLTRDTPPTASSVFKVIKSIEGGCPSTNPGNVGTDPFGYGADTFNYTIPEGVVGVGNYTLAWTWFNKIGDREMYMNCAPVTVTAAPGKKTKRDFLNGRRRGGVMEEKRAADALDSLPDMFRANSGNGCSTAASGTVLAIPAANLGKDIQKIGTDPLTPPIGNCGEQQAAASNLSVPQASSTSPTVTPTPLSTTSTVPVATPYSSAVAPIASSAPSAAAAPAVAGTTTGTCSTPGKSVCSPDGKGWGTCMEDNQVIYQAVAVGTRCDAALGVEVPA